MAEHILHESGCGWETGPNCTCGADPVGRSAESDALPRAERAVAHVVGRALVWLGKRAVDRGDAHAYGHALAALRAGDCRSSGCPIRRTCPVDPHGRPCTGGGHYCCSVTSPEASR